MSRVCIFEEIYFGIKTGYAENRHETIWKFHDTIILAKIAAITDIVPAILRIYLNSYNGAKTFLNHLRNDHRKEKSVVLTEMEITVGVVEHISWHSNFYCMGYHGQAAQSAMMGNLEWLKRCGLHPCVNLK